MHPNTALSRVHWVAVMDGSSGTYRQGREVDQSDGYNQCRHDLIATTGVALIHGYYKLGSIVATSNGYRSTNSVAHTNGGRQPTAK